MFSLLSKFESWEPRIDENAEISPRCLIRIKSDIKGIVTNPPQGIFALPDENNVRIMRVMVTGPSGTPYHGGIFSFLVGFPSDYPMNPPKVKCLTTGGNTACFNPNIYANGKVCLSILGTWSGPGWSPAMNLSSVVVSIQSLLNEEPLRNEPGYSRAGKEAVMNYNKMIQHETIRIAVVDVMEKKDTFHEYFAEKIETIFNQNYDHYAKVCMDNMHLDGKLSFNDEFITKPCRFQYKALLEKLVKLKH